MYIIAPPHGPLRPHFTDESADCQSSWRAVCLNESSLGHPGPHFRALSPRPPNGLEELLQRCWARLQGGRPGGGDARSPPSTSFRGCSDSPSSQLPPVSCRRPPPGVGEVSLQPKARPGEGPSCVLSTGLGGSAHTALLGAGAPPPLDQREDSGERCAPVIVGVLFITLYVLQRFLTASGENAPHTRHRWE